MKFESSLEITTYTYIIFIHDIQFLKITWEFVDMISFLSKTSTKKMYIYYA